MGYGFKVAVFFGSDPKTKEGVRPHFKYKHLHHLLSDLNNGTDHGLLAYIQFFYNCFMLNLCAFLVQHT